MSKYTYATSMKGDRLGNYWLLDEAIKAVKNDFFWFHCHWGLKGVEKSNSVLGFGYDLLHALYPNWSDEKIWMWIKKLIVFDVETYDAVVDEAKHGEVAYIRDGFRRVPIIIWDDMGMYFSKRKAMTKEKQLWLDEFDAVREDIGLLVCTTPKPDKPQKGLRDEYTHEIHWKEAGWGLVEYYDQGISKKPGESKVYKKMIHGISSRWIPKEQYMDYRYMKQEAKDRLKIARQMSFTVKDINRIIHNELHYVRDKDILHFAFESSKRDRGTPTSIIHDLYKKKYNTAQPYDGYLRDILRRLHGLGLLVYTVRGHYGEVKMTPKGVRCVEVLNDIEENPIVLDKTRKTH